MNTVCRARFARSIRAAISTYLTGTVGLDRRMRPGIFNAVRSDKQRSLVESPMAYDVHIVRTDDWFDAANDPVTKQDVDELIASDPELAWSTEDWVDMRDGRGKKVTRYFMILWKGQPCFWWYRDQIKCAGPSEEQVGKMVEIAGKLKARVVGDDGEAYRPDTWQAVYRGELQE